jgi:hypothetical protein
VKQAGWYRVRFRLDVRGQYARMQKSVKICPVSGPGLLTKPERERRKVEIVNSYGANSVERFNKVVVGTTERTFKEQAKWWLNYVQTRTFPKPIKPATARGWQSYLAKWLNPSIGDVSLMDVKNGVLKGIVEKLSTAGLSPKSVRNVVQVVTMVKSSAVDEDGNEIYPYTVPPALVKYWTGHANSSDGEVVRRTVTDRYVKMAKDTKFRAEVAERIGLGFELPKAEMFEVVPTVPSSQEMEAVVNV